MQLADVSIAEITELVGVLTVAAAALVPLRLMLRSYLRQVRWCDARDGRR